MMAIAFIAGSGLAKGLESVLEDFTVVPEHKNRFGTVLRSYKGTHNGRAVIILPRHGEIADGKPQRSPAELVRTRGFEANIWYLAESGVTEAYGFSAVGSLDRDLPLASNGVFVIPSSYGRGFAASQHSFGIDARIVHANMSQPFDPSASGAFADAVASAGYRRAMSASRSHGGLYIYNGGDAFETPQEIYAISRLYDHENFHPRVVGMTTVPEAQLCAQMGIRFATLCSNVNYAEGISTETLVSHEQTLDVMGIVAPMIVSIAKQLLSDRQV